MKKLVSLVLVLVLLSTMLVGCTKPATPETPVTPAPPVTEAPTTPDAPAAEGKVAKLGLGQNISIEKSRDAGVDANGKEILAAAQSDVTVAAVGFDKDGKVASITIDVAQTKVDFDKDLMVTSDKSKEMPTKLDLGADYGMIKASTIQKEWNEQIEALGAWMIGKNIDEIKGLNLKDGKPDVPELTSAVTVSVGGYIEAVEEAWNNSVDATGAETVGLGVKSYISKSKDLGKDANGKEILPVGQVDTYMTATAFDKDGKVVATIIDNAQVVVKFDAEGKVTSDKATAPMTKVELGNDYGMAKASSIQKEWFEQIGEFGNWMAGKSVDEILGLKVAEGGSVPDVAELTSLVTISVEEYQAIVKEASEKAR